MSPKSSAFLALVLAALALPLAAQNKNQIDWWRGTWEQALEEARQRNVPVVIAVIQDGEEANERLVDGILVDKSFVAAANGAVAIICSRENHGGVKIEKGAGQIEVCKRFGGTTCDAHIDHEVAMYRHFFQDEEVKTPQVMFCQPNLHVIERIIDVEGPGSYLKALEKAQKKLGPGLSAQLFKDSREMLTRGRHHVRQKEYREAWDAIAELAAVGGPAIPVQKALEIRKSIDEALDRELERAFKLAGEGEALKALILLDDLMTVFDGTPPEQKAKQAFSRIAKSKEGKAAARDLGRDKKLRPMLEKGAELEKQGEWLKARDTYRKVVEKGEELPVGQKAKARLDYLAADPDISRLIEQAEKDG